MPVADFRTSAATLRATWLSREPRRSQSLAADIPGLYHPLVEPKQVKLDALAYLAAHREPGVFDSDLRLYRVRATTGVFEWLQASGYGGAVLSRHYMSRGQFLRYGSYGAELKLRVRNQAELYATLERYRAGFVDNYPMSVLASAELDGAFDVLHPALEGKYTAYVGLRLVLGHAR